MTPPPKKKKKNEGAFFVDPDSLNLYPDPDPAFQVNPDLAPDQDTGLWWPKVEKKFFIIKIAIDLSLGLLEGRHSYRRSLQPSKENIQHVKKWNLLTLFLLLYFPLMSELWRAGCSLWRVWGFYGAPKSFMKALEEIYWKFLQQKLFSLGNLDLDCI